MLFTKGRRFNNQQTLSLWDHMLAEITQNDRPQGGTCQGGRCFVEVNGDSVLLDENEQYAHESDPCLQYTCSVRDTKCNIQTHAMRSGVDMYLMILINKTVHIWCDRRACAGPMSRKELQF